jgi:DnaJ-class molecular chaperone
MATMASYGRKDFYKILKIEHTATAQEIKVAYYRMAQQLHPDKHGGCSFKLAEFKRVTEAYDVLSDKKKRHEYDFYRGLNQHQRYSGSGQHANGNAKTFHKSKLYTARPPPHWKFTWDHAKHQGEFHSTCSGKPLVD